MKDSPPIQVRRESQKVWDFFQRATRGVFVDVGANHPVIENQTWFLERCGWKGVLIEPNPEMVKLLREQRPGSQVWPVAVGHPNETGEKEFHLAGPQSTLSPDFDTAVTDVVRVPLRTLDSVLAESGIGRVDFLSLDVEGLELEALAGFDFARWQPRLILIEDFFYDHARHNFLAVRGYKLVRRTGYNNWYVPQASAASMFAVCSPLELFNLFRKMWISGPLIGHRRAWRRRRMESRINNV